MDANAIAVSAGVFVGLILVWAGIAKLRAGRQWPLQAADMGVSRSLAVVVPWIEIFVGALTASQIFRPWPALAASLLFLAFTALVALRLRDDERPPCSCFGASSDAPLSWRHLVRNVGLLGLAVLAVTAS